MLVFIGWLNFEMEIIEISMYVYKKILLDFFIICFIYIIKVGVKLLR